MRVLVTGALGHIGSHLVRTLPDLMPTADIVLIDNLRTQRFASLFDLPASARYRFVECDVTDASLTDKVAGADVVVHLAAITDATASIDNAEEVLDHNVSATRRVAEACATTGARLIALSTTSVYGSQAAVVDEDCDRADLAPQSPYAEAKLREEDLIQRAVADDGLRAVICRFGTIFGPSVGMRFHTAVNKFCWQAVFGRPLTVWTTAYEQKRPYLDLVDAARMLAFLGAREDLFDGTIYNVLTTNATVREIVEVIRQFVPGTAVELTDSPVMNQLSYEVSRERSEDLGFSYCGSLEKGIGDTIARLRAAHSLP